MCAGGYIRGRCWNVLLAVMLVLWWAAVVQAAPPAWPTYGHDPRHTGQSAVAGPGQPVVRGIYTFPAPGAGPLLAPVIGGDGTVYAGTRFTGCDALYAFPPDGRPPTTFVYPNMPNGNGPSTAAIGADGTVYVVYDRLYALAPDGTVKWTYAAPGGLSTPVLDGSGMIDVVSGNTVISLTPGGAVRWTRTLPYPATLPTALWSTYVMVGAGNNLYLLDQVGLVRATVPLSGLVGCPVVGADGCTYVGTSDGKLHAIANTGVRKWSLAVGEAPSPLALDAAGTLYCGVGSRRVVAVTTAGVLKWTYQTGSAPGGFTEPAIGADGIVYLCAHEGVDRLYAFKPDGTLLWDYVSGYTQPISFGAPSLGPDGTLYLRSNTRDGVQSITALARDATPVQPDLSFCPDTGGYPVGVNIINGSGLDQTLSQTVTEGQCIRYRVRVVNTGTVTTNFRVCGQSSLSGWTVQYRDALYGAERNITAEMTGAGWTTPPLAPGEEADILVEVTPSLLVAFNSKCDVKISAVSRGANVCGDMVIASTKLVAVSYQPDLAFQSDLDPVWVGNGIYGLDSRTQSRVTPVVAGKSIIYAVTLRNDGNTAARYLLSGTSAPAGWSLEYRAPNGQDITALLCASDGWDTGLLPPGSGFTFTVVVRLAETLAPNSRLTLQLTARMVNKVMVMDAVAPTVLAVAPIYQPDLWVRAAGDAAYLGDNFYSPDGSCQTKSQRAFNSMGAVYECVVQNDGTIPLHFLITSTAPPPGWSACYADANGTDITAAVMRNGWDTGVIAPGCFTKFSVWVFPDRGITSTCALLITAWAPVPGGKSDSVKIITRGW